VVEKLEANFRTKNEAGHVISKSVTCPMQSESQPDSAEYPGNFSTTHTAGWPIGFVALAMRQFKRADRGWLLQGLREGFEVKVRCLSQIGKGFFFGVTLAGRADFGTLGHKPVGF
jgi:hypothetical protein